MAQPPRHHRHTATAMEAEDREALRARVAALPPLIRPSRVAALLDVNRQRVYDLVATGHLSAVNLGVRNTRVVRESLERLLGLAG